MAYRKHFSYSTGPVVVPANGTATGIITIDADADFECRFFEGSAIQAGVLIFNWAGTILITDSALSFGLSNVAITFDAIAGNGRQPYPLEPAKRIKKNSSLTFAFNDPSGVQTTVYFVLSGNKLVPQPGDPDYGAIST